MGIRPCPGHGRHWFTFYGAPGYRSPYCQRGCGTPNPRPLTDADWRYVEQWRELVGRLDAQTEAALAAHRERRAAAARKVRDILAEIRELGA